MKVGSFMENIVRKNIDTFELSRHSPLEGASDWNFRYIIAKMTEKITYGCDYNDKDICKNSAWGFKNKINNKCCCNLCYSHIGYLNTIEPASLREIANLFRANIGFWRAEGGCALPRAWRSYTCLSYRCNEVHNKKGSLSKRDTFILELLRENSSGIGNDRYSELIKLRREIYDESLTLNNSGYEILRINTWELINNAAEGYKYAERNH